MNKQIISFAKVFIALDFSLIIYSFFFENFTWLINTQVAFISSLLITIASFLSYRKNVQGRLSKAETHKYTTEDRDKVDEIDDPFDLYTEYEEIPEDELTTEKIKEIIKEEKVKVKKNSLKNTLTSTGGFISVYRIFGYGSLIFGFFALNNNGMFQAIAFLIGLSVVPLGVLASKLIFKA